MSLISPVVSPGHACEVQGVDDRLPVLHSPHSPVQGESLPVASSGLLDRVVLRFELSERLSLDGPYRVQPLLLVSQAHQAGDKNDLPGVNQLRCVQKGPASSSSELYEHKLFASSYFIQSC